MSGSRNTASENSENETDRFCKHQLQTPKRASYVSNTSNESLSPSQYEDIPQSSKTGSSRHSSASSLHLSPIEAVPDSLDHTRNSSGGVSDGEQSKGSIKSSPPILVLNSTPSVETDLERSLDSSSVLDGGSGDKFPDNVSRSSESGRSVDFGPQRTPEPQPKLADHKSSQRDSDKSKNQEKKEKKKSSWYNMLNPTYKSRSDDFKRIFKDLPDAERLIVDYSCALQKDILVQGRLYVSQNYISFYANIFRWETILSIRCRDITSMTKEKTARVIPNAIQISTENEKHFFTSFGAREKTFLMLFRIWQNALIEQPFTNQEFWQYIHHSYGYELGLTSDDDDYIAPAIEAEEVKRKTSAEYSLDEKEKFDDKEDEFICDNEDPPQPFLNGTDEDNHSVDPPPTKSSDYIPTDMSDTTESDDNNEDIEITCPCVSHEGKEVLNTVFPLSVDQVFALIFNGSKFYNDLLQSRKTYDIIESPWQLCPEFDLKMRQVTYTLTLNHSMAKSAQTTETQKLLKHTKPGQIYTVECDVVNTGIPYADAFTVKSLYCMTRVSRRESRLRISGCVHYKKSVWGLVKSLIEKSAMQGLADFATDLASALEKEATGKAEGAGAKGRRRKRMKFEPPPLKDAPRLQRQPTLRNLGSSITGIDLASIGSTPDIVIRVILITLVILLFLNMLLFYKLWSLEDQSSKPVPPVILDYVDRGLTGEEWAELLQRQEGLHRAETERWRDALQHVLHLVELIEKSLSELKSNIDTYSISPFLKSLQGVTTEEVAP